MKKLDIDIKKFLDRLGNKKFVYNLLIVLVIGIILLISSSFFLSKDKDSVESLNTGVDYNFTNTFMSDMEYSSFLEAKLEEILMELKGVGQVKVMMTLDDTMEKIPAFNTIRNNETTSETDSQGGTREITREDVDIQVVTSGDGGLMVLKERKPTVRGVIVIAEGADDLEIKEMVYEAVKTVLGVSGNRVEVYSSK